MKDLKVFEYEGMNITFDIQDNTFVNATEMAKTYGKRPADFLKTGPTREFIEALSATKGIVATDLVIVRNGGTRFGTWMHEDVALEFARWLSPAFAIWCNDRIKELLTTGKASIQDITKKDLALMIVESEEKIERLESENNLKNKTIQLQAPKVEYHDKVLQSAGTYNTNQIAKELGMSARSLNKTLHELRVQYKQGGTWLLYQKYQSKGYTKTRTYTYKDQYGVESTAMQTTWTESGRKFIHCLIKESDVA